MNTLISIAASATACNSSCHHHGHLLSFALRYDRPDCSFSNLSCSTATLHIVMRACPWHTDFFIPVLRMLPLVLSDFQSCLRLRLVTDNLVTCNKVSVSTAVCASRLGNLGQDSLNGYVFAFGQWYIDRHWPLYAGRRPVNNIKIVTLISILWNLGSADGI